MPPRIRSIGFLLVCLLVWTWCFWRLRFPYVGDVWDDGNYIVGAQALHDGVGYTLPSRPGPPIRPMYPIGFPALLALFGAGASDTAAFLVEGSFGWLLAAAVWVWFRRLGWQPLDAALGAGAVAFACLPRNRNVMADLPLTAIAAVLFARWQGPSSTTGAFCNGALAAFAFLLRRPGIALFPGALIGPPSATSRLAALAGFLLIDLPLEWRASRFPQSLTDAYLPQAWGAGWGSLSKLSGILLHNVSGLVVAVPETAAPFLLSRSVRALPIGVPLAIAAGLWVLLFRGARSLSPKREPALLPVWICAALTFGVIAIWPWPVGLRLAMPLTSAVVLALGCGAAGFGSRRSATIALAILLAGNLALSVRVGQSAVADPRVGDVGEMLDFVRRNTPADAITISDTPEMIYRYTGRQGIPLLDPIEWARPGHADSVRLWLPRAAGRPLYLVGACMMDFDTVAVQTRAFLSELSAGSREVFRTRDCRFAIYTITMRSDRFL